MERQNVDECADARKRDTRRWRGNAFDDEDDDDDHEDDHTVASRPRIPITTLKPLRLRARKGSFSLLLAVLIVGRVMRGKEENGTAPLTLTAPLKLQEIHHHFLGNLRRRRRRRRRHHRVHRHYHGNRLHPRRSIEKRF